MAKPTIRTCAGCDMENDQPGSICRPCSDALHHLTNQDGTWAPSSTWTNTPSQP